MTSTLDYMARALQLARQARGTTSPNPAVGAVVVQEGHIVGEGYTQPPGGDHAEIGALKQAGDRARGATMYVTLEPCCHHGRTSPCTQAIIAAGLAEVHLALPDPNPRVRGEGKAELERAGLRILEGEGREEAQEINEDYFKYITTGLPFVVAKFGMSLDGKLATWAGDSRWISGSQARKYGHGLRRLADVVMVGVNTVIRDDPQLTAREDERVVKTPLRVIVDSHGRTPVSSQVFRQPGKALLATTAPLPPPLSTALAEAGVELLELPARAGGVDLRSLLLALGQREAISVLVEGGGTLLGSFFDYQLVDKVYAFISPIIIGGEDAPTPVQGKGVANIGQAFQLVRPRVERLGEDVLISGYVKREGAG